MKRTAPLPANLAPWFTIDPLTGAVQCRKCPSVFLGQQASDSALARHVSVHLGVKPRPVAVARATKPTTDDSL